MKESYGYWLDFTFPEKGHVKVIISDCRTENLREGFALYYDDDNGRGFYQYSSGEYKYVSKNIEDVDSGWISVIGGHCVVRIPASYTPNVEAKFMIQYQKFDEYNGEIEDNDNFDTATLIKNNTVYEVTAQNDYELNWGSE